VVAAGAEVTAVAAAIAATAAATAATASIKLRFWRGVLPGRP